MKRVGQVAAVGAAVLSMMALMGGAPATAGWGGGGGGTDTADGYGGWVVDLRGHVSTSLKGSVSRPTPLCWWEPIGSPDPDDAQGTYEWFSNRLSTLGPYSAGAKPHFEASSGYPAAFEDAVEADKRGLGVTWYELKSAQGVAMETVVSSGCTDSVVHPDLGEVPISYRYFPHRTPPEPVIDEKVLAEYAYRVMDLVAPSLQWNPKIDGRGDAALVNLPTWMWVDDADAVGEREVRASVGGVTVTVTAAPSEMRVSSPAGSADCTTAQARRAYARGREESSACTLTFSRGSYNNPTGFAVTATVPWTASWQSSTGGGGDLAARTVNETTKIRVAQSQALVTDVG